MPEPEGQRTVVSSQKSGVRSQRSGISGSRTKGRTEDCGLSKA